MASNSKHTDWILETIDHLRRRKARPDLERICHVVRRRFGLNAAETEAKLERLVDAEIVIKVDYKGNTSYRNAAKWRKSMLGCAVLNSTTVSIKIIEAILEMSKACVKEIHAKRTGSDTVTTAEEFPEYESEVQHYATEVGIPMDNISEWLRSHCEGFDKLKSPVIIVLKREIDAGRIKRLLNCNYVLTEAQMDQVGDSIKPLKSTRKTEGGATKAGAASCSPTDTHNGGSSAAASANEESNSSSTATSASSEHKPKSASGSGGTHGHSSSHSDHKPSSTTTPTPGPSAAAAAPQPARRGRPPKHRPPSALASQPTPPRATASTTSATTAATSSPTSSGLQSHSKLKRILTSDPGSHVHAASQPKVTKRETKKGSAADEPVCDFCEFPSISNPKGEPEMLLHCKDCTAKAHPSCMSYSKLLASRACRGPWQCMDCKTCCFCLDAGDPDQMLFCDGCDKGYHMNCHQPAINKKPSGTWECSECRFENMALQRSEFMTSIGNKHAFSQESAPPTPAESPVPANTVMNGELHIPTKPEYLGNGKYPDASGWSVSDVVEYLTSAGFSEEAKVFKEQEIDGVALLLLKRADVLKGLELKLGPALKVNRHIQGLQTARQHLT